MAAIEQGVPERTLDWTPTPTVIGIASGRRADGVKVHRMTIDSGPVRLITDWTDEELRYLIAHFQQVVSGIEVADESALKGLPIIAADD